jgi:O-antigen ligase
MTAPVVTYVPHRGVRLLRPSARPLPPAEAHDRSVRRRIFFVWALLLLNVIPFYKGTWNGLPLIIPIPSFIGKVMTQGSLPLALLLALSVNPKRLLRPNVFLCLLSLLVITAIISGVNPTAGRFISTLYRTCRLGGFVATLWLLTPWWGRRDLLLVKCHLKALAVVMGSLLLGLIVAPGRAMAQGRLSGEFWPITPVQVSDFTAVALGLIVVLWFCGEMSRRLTLFAVLATSTLLLLTHTRTEVIALVAGILVAGLRIFGTQARVRRTFALVAIVVSITVTIFSGVLTTWLARGQDTSELTKLTGRTTVWADVLNAPRDRFQLLFGYGLSNKGFNGLPIDSNWIAAYYDLGLIGVAICIACVLFVLVSAYFQRRTARTALALFLVTYLLITSFTETGLSDASGYLLELALAASLLVTPVEEGGPG